MKRILRKLHLWLAFPAGLLVTVICFTGAILVFRAELEDMMYPERFFVKEVKAETIPLHKLMPLINEQLENDVATGITVINHPKRTYTVSIASDYHNPQYVDPYSGVLIKVDGSASFFSVVMRLHRWLLVDRQTGAKITGWTTLLFIVILITGAIIVIPKSRKGIKRILTVKTKNGWRRFWYDLHLSAGVYAWALLMLLSLTALTWSFRWYAGGVYKLFGVELPVRRPMPAPVEAAGQRQTADFPSRDTTAVAEGRGERSERQGRQHGETVIGEQRPGGQSGRGGEQRGGAPQPTVNFTHWQSVLENIKAKNPNYLTVSLRNASATVAQNRIWGNSRATDRYTFNEETGEITCYQPYEKQDKAVKMRGWLYALHVGAWGGTFSKIITCLASLIGASLPLTGYYIWFKKRRKRKKR
ncbi:MAG: PepSY domain-containing protein [Tannerella sp.]|nr:PepSY domain-containing protein [Tannerella sp.]